MAHHAGQPRGRPPVADRYLNDVAPDTAKAEQRRGSAMGGDAVRSEAGSHHLLLKVGLDAGEPVDAGVGRQQQADPHPVLNPVAIQAEIPELGGGHQAVLP